MSKMISVASGFQYSVNIAYDLGSDEKLKNFIPTRSALNLLKDILLSTNPTSTERARILIGAYGRGKSHIVLMILSMLMGKDPALLEKAMPSIRQDEKLYQLLTNYYESGMKILPIIISGSNTSLTQAFLLALERTLRGYDLMDIMPETNYQAAIMTINRWKDGYQKVYKQFEKEVDMPVDKFIAELKDFNIEIYEQFERVYPKLTAGSTFNPFSGFDVIEIYESVIKELKSKGYSGIYLVYDEFSKFLEANISEASVSDTKMLQDFAEKCNRSGDEQMHIILISHKEIANYIDKLPKQKVDGWRGVSGRFKHEHLHNNFTQTYEIISTVIQKDKKLWQSFRSRHADDFKLLAYRYIKHPILKDESEDDWNRVINGCYPLHPISTYILPRLSEKVAQNERTLFTFLSANGESTLSSFLKNYNDDSFRLLTPDMIYDYFSPQLKKEVYAGAIHDYYILTEKILEKIENGTLESKIIKTLSLIYILEQFEKLAPTSNELLGIYERDYSAEYIKQAIENLIEKEYVIYWQRSNDYLRLKETSGVDINRKISDTVEIQRNSLTVKDMLNKANFDNYMYPSRYNDEKEMTRYFSFEFIDEDELEENTEWDIKSETIQADGIIYGIIPNGKDSIISLREKVAKSSRNYRRYIFIVPKHYIEIDNTVRRYTAAITLRDAAASDRVLRDEYEVIYEDLQEVVNNFISSYTRPESLKATYIFDGKERDIPRKTVLTNLLSDICEETYGEMPVINNETINKDKITPTAVSSRTKIITALLRNELENGLGFTGTGQEVSIMRSTLLRTGVMVEEKNGITHINLHPEDKLMENLLKTITNFILKVRKNGSGEIVDLYDDLTSARGHIGIRKGLIPIYLAAVFHEYRKEIILSDKYGQVSLSADTLLQMNSKPSEYSMVYLDWNAEKETFVSRLEKIFKKFVITEEKSINSYGYVVAAMKRWYMALPKYSKGIKILYDGSPVDKSDLEFLKLLRQDMGSHELLFKKLPEAFMYRGEFNANLSDNIRCVKERYDNVLKDLKVYLAAEVKKMFCDSKKKLLYDKMSLSSIIKDWMETLRDGILEQIFSDGTQYCLELFNTVTNDESIFIEKLAKVATGLRLEDWDESTVKIFYDNLKKYKATAEAYKPVLIDENALNSTNTYQVTFANASGETVTKRFKKIDESPRGHLLYNTILSQIENMGQSISEQEKRQILMEVLKKLC